MISHEFLSKQDFALITFKSVYAEEHNAIQKLNESDSYAVKFSYPTAKKAISARASLIKYINILRKPLEAIQRKSDVIIYKK